jgi:hypothetical protein
MSLSFLRTSSIAPCGLGAGLLGLGLEPGSILLGVGLLIGIPLEPLGGIPAPGKPRGGEDGPDFFDLILPQNFLNLSLKINPIITKTIKISKIKIHIHGKELSDEDVEGMQQSIPLSQE